VIVFCAASGIIIVTNFKQLFENVEKINVYASSSILWDIKFNVVSCKSEDHVHIFFRY
jgi:cytochrome b subunit of formate dehydrogenase